MERIGTTLGGRYRLGAKIGTGGMSDVYAATDELLGRDVAVKMMRPDLARDTNFLERFRREAQNAAKLNHQAIVAIYDTGETPEADGAVPYIVMERVHGETLRDIIRDRGKMGLAEAANVMAQVCDALHFSHEAGIIHRDIKPANIMITNTGMVKVMDFGIARALSDSSSAMTQTAAVIGTAQYLSPEQARGKSADARSDIYAAGCVLFELTTGRPPFQGESAFSVAFQHVQDQVMQPSTVQGMHLSKREALSLDSIILTAMAKQPSDRYDDAQQMSTDLRRLSEDQLPLVAQAYTEGDGTDGSGAAGAAGNGADGSAHKHSGLGKLVGGAAAAGAAGAAGYAATQGNNAGHAANLGDGASDATTVLPTQSFDTATGNQAGQNAQAYGQQGYNDPNGTHYNTAGYPHGAQGGVPGGVGAAGAAGVGAGAGAAAYNGHSGNVDGYSTDYEDEPHRRGKGAVALWTIAALLLVGAGGYIGLKTLDDNSSEDTVQVAEAQDVTLPDVANQPRSDAEKALTALGLKVNIEERADQEVARDNAIGTDPAAGSSLPAGSTVTLLVSTGKEITEVPDLTGMTTEQASKALSDAKLQLNSSVREESSADIPKGQVISQNPPQGSQVSAGTKITITVSTGKEQVTVPTVTGEDLDSARNALVSAGFTVNVNQVDSPEPLNQVLSATGEGEQMDRGSEITLTVSKNNQIAMPSITGMKYSDAVSALQRAGWTGGNLGRTNANTSDLLKVDTIANQSIPAGTTIEKNAAISVGVYVFSLLP